MAGIEVDDSIGCMPYDLCSCCQCYGHEVGCDGN